MPTARELIEQARNYMGDLREAVSLANRAYETVLEDIRYATERLAFKEKSNYPTIYARAYVRSMINSGIASEILKAQIDQAIQINDEFSLTIYKDMLYQVASSSDIFTFTLAGGGWKARLSPIISFESVAGTLEDWARGINLYRDALGVDVGNNRGQRATRYWFKRVYRTELETETVEGRLSYAGRIAPFWQILNSGSPTNLPSDRGGFNPVQSSPTDFIGEAELKLKQHFLAAMDAEHVLWREEVKGLKAAIDEGSELIAEIRELIDNLSADEVRDRAIIAALNRRSRSGDITEFVNREKLREAVRKYRAGEDFTTQRIELTAQNNAGRRVRPRVGTFIRAIESYGEL